MRKACLLFISFVANPPKPVWLSPAGQISVAFNSLVQRQRAIKQMKLNMSALVVRVSPKALGGSLAICLHSRCFYKFCKEQIFEPHSIKELSLFFLTSFQRIPPLLRWCLAVIGIWGIKLRKVELVTNLVWVWWEVSLWFEDSFMYS